MSGGMSSCSSVQQEDTYTEEIIPSYPLVPSQKQEFMWINVKIQTNGSADWNGMSKAICRVGCYNIIIIDRKI